jgi:F-box/leucine-rich repeat protein 17
MADATSVDDLPDEILVRVFYYLGCDTKTLFTRVPAVCRRWRQVCCDTRGVHLDFRLLRKEVRHSDVECDVPTVTALTARFKHIVGCALCFVPQDDEHSFVVALAERCKELTSVEVWDRRLTDASVVALAKHCTHLTRVSFRWCDRLTDVSVVALAMNCLQLTDVDFGSCGELTDTSVVALAKNCPQLTDVNFELCTLLTDTSVIALAKNCPQLTDVNFGSCDELTDTSIVALAMNCRLLRHVNFELCKLCNVLTDAIVITLAKNCPLLRNVDFEVDKDKNEGFPLLTNASVVALTEYFPQTYFYFG